MRKITYKNISPDLDKLVKPGVAGRMSVGFDKNVGEYYFIDADDLLPFKNQARTYFNEEEIQALSDSIKMHGVRQPLTILPSKTNVGKYEVVSGERRLKAAKLAGINKLPCIIINDTVNAEEIAIIENIHRQDLHPIELGNLLKNLLDQGVFKSQTEIVEKLALLKSGVSESLKLSEIDRDIAEFLISRNIKNRSILRKVVKYKDNPDVIKNFLGMNSLKSSNFSVLRVRFEDNDFQCQSSGIKKLSNENKSKLKLTLQKIINTL